MNEMIKQANNGIYCQAKKRQKKKSKKKGEKIANSQLG